MNDVKTSQYHLFDYNRDNVSIVVYSCALANKINKYLNNYYPDVRIVKGEEPVFKLNKTQFVGLRKMTAFKHITLK